MRYAINAFAGCLWASMLASGASAQPTLDRVERSLHEQVDGSQPQQAVPAVDAAEPGYLGLTADNRQVSGGGVLVGEVTPGSPAAQGGLLVGDVITAIDGRPIRALDDMAQAMAGKPVGATLVVTVNRVGAQRQQTVTLGRQPQSRLVGPPRAAAPAPAPPPAGAVVANSPGATPPPRLGIRTVPVSDDVRAANGLTDGRGATVIAVTVDSPAHRAGIPLGAVITAVDNRPIDNPQSLASAIQQAGAEVELAYVERGQGLTRRVALAGAPVNPDAANLESRSRPLAGPNGPKSAEAPQLDAPADATRVEALEARIRELEARLEKLEAALTNQPKP